jgi:hypothetical protein
MSKHITIYCDICKNEITDKTYRGVPRNLSITTFCNEKNPLHQINGAGETENTFTSEDTCFSCVHLISLAITQTIQTIKNIEPLPT